MILFQALRGKINSLMYAEKPKAAKTKIELIISAAQAKGLKGIQELQEQGMDINFLENNASPLIWALKNKKFKEALFLVELGADLTTLKDSAGLTSLHYAAMFAPEKLMAYILQTLKAKMSSQTAADASKVNANAKAGPAANASNANPGPNLLDIQDDFEWTPMFWAIYMKNYKAVELLIEAGADVHIICNNQTYLQRVADDRFSNLNNNLQEAGMIDSESILHLVDLFIKKGVGVDTISPLTDFSTPLYSAVSWQDFELCDRLVKAGADLNIRCDVVGNTPFLHAAQLCNEQLLMYFLSRNSRCLYTLDNQKLGPLAKVLLSTERFLNDKPELRYQAAECLVLAGASLDFKIENKDLLQLANEKDFTQESFKLMVLAMPHLKSCLNFEHFSAIANHFEALYLKQSKAEFGKEDIHLVNMNFFMGEIYKEDNSELDKATYELFQWNKETILESAKQNKELTESILCSVLKQALKKRLNIYFFKPRDDHFFAQYVNQVLFEKGLLQDETQSTVSNLTLFDLPNVITTLMMKECLFFDTYRIVVKPLHFSHEANSPFHIDNVEKARNIIIQTRCQRILEAVEKWQKISTEEKSKNKYNNEKAQITAKEVFLECSNIKEIKPDTDKKELTEVKKGEESKKQCEYARHFNYLVGRPVTHPCEHSSGKKACEQCQKIQPFYMRFEWTREIPSEQVHLLELLNSMNITGELFHYPLPRGNRILIFPTHFKGQLSPWASSPHSQQEQYTFINPRQQRAVSFHCCKDCQQMEIRPVDYAPNAKEFCHLSPVKLSTPVELLSDEVILQSSSSESTSNKEISIKALKAKLERPPTKRGKLIPNTFYFNQDSFPMSIKFPDEVLLRIQKDKQGVDRVHVLKKEDIKVMADDVDLPFRIVDNVLYFSFRTNPFQNLYRPWEYDKLKLLVTVYYLNNNIEDQKAIQIIQRSDQKPNSSSNQQQSIGLLFANSKGNSIIPSAAAAQKLEMIFKSSFRFYMWPHQGNANTDSDTDLDTEDYVASKGVVTTRRYDLIERLQLQVDAMLQRILISSLNAYLGGHFNAETNADLLKEERSRRNALFTKVMSESVEEARLYFAQAFLEIAQYINLQHSSAPVLLQGILQLLDFTHSLGAQGKNAFIQLLQMYFPLLFKESAQITLQLRREPPNAAPQFVILEITLTSLGRIKAGLNRIILEYVGEDLMSNADCIPAEIFTVQDQKLFTINESIEADSRELKAETEQKGSKDLIEASLVNNPFYQVSYTNKYLLEVLNINDQGNLIPVIQAVNTNLAPPTAVNGNDANTPVSGSNATPLLLSQPAVNQSSPAQNNNVNPQDGNTNPPEFTDRKDNTSKNNTARKN